MTGPLDDPIIRSPYVEVRLERMRAMVAMRIGAGAAERLGVRPLRDEIENALIVRLETELLAERLPPQYLDSKLAFTSPRFATWWDHFCATYRSKWWGRLLRLPSPRFVDEPFSHVARVVVAPMWTYPRATRVLPGDEWGHVVLKADAGVTESFRWF